MRRKPWCRSNQSWGFTPTRAAHGCRCLRYCSAMSDPTEDETPFALLSGAPRIRELVETFYDYMGQHEPELARLHPCTPEGQVERESRDRFALFLIGWLGGSRDRLSRQCASRSSVLPSGRGAAGVTVGSSIDFTVSRGGIVFISGAAALSASSSSARRPRSRGHCRTTRPCAVRSPPTRQQRPR
jgi:hypothetical protein